MSVVRPEYGPTLPELVAPRIAGVPRRTRVVVAIAAVAVVAAAVAALVLRGADPVEVVVREPVAFTLVFDEAALQRVAPPAGAELALRERGDRAPQRLRVEPLELPAYRGDPSAAVLGISAQAIDRLRREVPGFVLRSEGRFRLNEATSGYAISFQGRDGGKVRYGKQVLAYPDPAEGDPMPREALRVTLLLDRSPANPNVDSVGVNGPLKRPLRSIRFGTERP